MINWELSKISPPPIIASLTDKELFLQTASGPLYIPNLPCHSQAVERAVKKVTRVSSKVFGHHSRHGMLISSEVSLKKTPRLDSKKDYLLFN
jgi:hypothetical protein